MLAKESGEAELGKLEFKKLVLRVVAMHGIKELPAKVIMALCYESWLTKFAPQMTVAELHLAFEMNVNGDFSIKGSGGEIIHKVNHFQCFSREFFCDVLNQYLSERVQTNKQIDKLKKEFDEQEQKKLLPPDVTLMTFEAIMEDYKEFHGQGYEAFSPTKEFDTAKNYPTSSKLELLYQVYDINISEENVDMLRGRAKDFVLRALHKKKEYKGKGSDKERVFGMTISIEHQISRIKEGKLLNIEDEILIQAYVNRLLYMQIISLEKPDAEIEESSFIKHIKENIQIYLQNK